MSNIIKRINIPLNRAEGDLEVHVDITDGVITDAWSCGTMYRGFEDMMVARGVLDGLVITPRICGICSLSHLTAAVGVLDVLTGISVPDNAIRLSNIALMAETIQSDIRQSILMYMSDFANPEVYSKHAMFEDAFRRYSPLKGSSAQDVIRESKKLIEIIAIIGGQWPHTSFMVPGGVTSIPEIHKILQCRLIIKNFKNWYEKRILGCSLDRWNSITSVKKLLRWLDESQRQKESEVGFFLRFCMATGIDKIGKGVENFISFGNLLLPESTTVQPIESAKSATLKDNSTKDKYALESDGLKYRKRFIPSGFARGVSVEPFNQAKISEDISHSWYEPSSFVEIQAQSTNTIQPSKPIGSLHPFKGTTKPYASGNSGDQYSWTKAPRYDGLPAETGPLAEMIIQGNPLFQDMVKSNGVNAMVRQLARIVRPVALLPIMEIWLDELMVNRKAPFYNSIKDIPDGDGAGMIEAARGALGHWVSIRNSKISHYQIITPTAWNGSPRDANKLRGPWEEALIGTPIKNLNSLIEAGHVVRSFDPCMVCSVH
ncbi:MAG: nickel-dependent hydrogenase large subunit [Desulfamplus sp.]|nr:nickel-dependent hydrogenase large subunit [Desulfamplus sp.]